MHLSRRNSKSRTRSKTCCWFPAGLTGEDVKEFDLQQSYFDSHCLRCFRSSSPLSLPSARMASHPLPSSVHPFTGPGHSPINAQMQTSTASLHASVFRAIASRISSSSSYVRSGARLFFADRRNLSLLIVGRASPTCFCRHIHETILPRAKEDLVRLPSSDFVRAFIFLFRDDQSTV
jgi:hypothetical protein